MLMPTMPMPARLAVVTLASTVTVAAMGWSAPAIAKPMSRAEIGKAMIGRTITVRRFGLPIRMVYNPNGRVTAKAPIGSTSGTWRWKGSNQVCTTFASGPAKGTDCVSFTDLGDGRYRSSAGVTFRVR